VKKIKQTLKAANKKIHKLKWLVIATMMTPQLTFAFGSGISAGDDKLSKALEALASYLMSTPAKIAGVLAIIGIGYMTAFTTKLPKGQAVAAVAGIGIIFGAGFLVKEIFGVSSF